MPFFSPGISISTTRGERAIGELCVGDRVVTRDNGIQEISWVGQRTLEAAHFSANSHLLPIHVSKGSLGRGLPERDMLVSPSQRILVSSAQTMLQFEEHEGLVAAKHLVNNRTIKLVKATSGTFVQVAFHRHEVILANGCWMESFQPADRSLNGLGNTQRSELFELFPDLAETPAGKRDGSKGMILSSRP